MNCVVARLQPRQSTGADGARSRTAAGAQRAPDAELLARTALADQTAFAELYRLTSSHLYGVALRILRESAAAEEVLQESFVNVWHHAGSYVAAKSQPLTWLTSIVRNRCLDQLRRREVDTVTIDDEDHGMTIADDGPRPAGDAAERRRSASRSGAASRRSTAGQKQAIALAFYQGLSHSELARHLAPAAGHGQVVGAARTRAPEGMPRRRRRPSLSAERDGHRPTAMNYRTPERADALAAQYVLGTLSRAGARPLRSAGAWRPVRGCARYAPGKTACCRWPKACRRSRRRHASGRPSSPASIGRRRIHARARHRSGQSRPVARA